MHGFFVFFLFILFLVPCARLNWLTVIFERPLMPNFRSVYLQIKPETDNERSRKVYTGKGKPVSVEIDGNSKRLPGSRQERIQAVATCAVADATLATIMALGMVICITAAKTEFLHLQALYGRRLWRFFE